MADADYVTLNEEHAPGPEAIEAFGQANKSIKEAVIKSRRDWDKHEPRMWAAASSLSDEELTSWDLEKDLVSIRAGKTSYGTLIFGKISVPGTNGFLHVRIHDPPNRGTQDVVFHSLFTDEIRDKPEEAPTDYRALQPDTKPLEFFHE